MGAFGAGAVGATVFAYALERRHRAFIALFAIGCAVSSAYGFAIGSVPFGALAYGSRSTGAAEDQSSSAP